MLYYHHLNRQFLWGRSMNMDNGVVTIKKILFFVCAVIVLWAASGSADSETFVGRESGFHEPLASLKCNQFTFDATKSYVPAGQNVSYLWDFGDGQTSRQPVAEHSYENSGDYTVTLAVVEESGPECGRAVSSQIVRVNIPPRAQFDSPTKACVNEEAAFDAGPSRVDNSKVLDYAWDFGDGTKRHGQRQEKKIYQKGGSYKVSLTVDDKSGTVCGTDTAEKVVRINEPPVAEAGPEMVLKCVGGGEDMTVAFDASKSSDVNNDALTYLWDFGDGRQAQGRQISHRYAEIGNYDVKLVVNDNTVSACATGVDFVTVRLNRVPQADAGEDITVCAGDDIRFDGSGSYADSKGTLDGKWFLGDGQTSDGLKATHRYDRPGVYQASLQVENKLNAMCPPARDTRVVTVNAMPEVNIVSADSVCLGDTVEFDASASDADGDSLEYYWSFGDGTISKDGPKAAHAYSQGGSYRVSIVVDDGKKTACSSASATTSVKVNTPPSADAGENTPCCIGMEADFDAGASIDPDGDALTYRWDFGDGRKAEGPRVKHAYAQSGSFPVTLIVDDHTGSSCSTSTAGFTAVVRDKPVSVIHVR